MLAPVVQLVPRSQPVVKDFWALFAELCKYQMAMSDAYLGLKPLPLTHRPSAKVIQIADRLPKPKEP